MATESWEDEDGPMAPTQKKETGAAAKPKSHIPQRSWADDDDEFVPQRPVVTKPVIAPAPTKTAAGPRGAGFGAERQEDQAGGGGAGARDFRDDRGPRGDFSNFGSRRGERGERGGFRGERYGGPRRRGSDDGQGFGGEGGAEGRGPRSRGPPGERRGRPQVDFDDREYEVQTVDTWDGFGFKEEVLRGILSKGFEKPSLCQTQGIKPLLDGRNLLLQAQSGHGKTAIFATAILNNIDTSVAPRESVQAIVLCPNRDLARQVSSEIESLGQYLDPPLRIQCCTGSPNVKSEEARDERVKLVKELKTNPPHILVGTPGRICDLAQAREKLGPVVWLGNVRYFVLDEADEMLFNTRLNDEELEQMQHGGKPNVSSSNFEMVKSLTYKINKEAKIALLSATFSRETLDAAKVIFPRSSFVLVTLKDEQLNRANIQQFYIVVHRNDERVWLPELMKRKLDILEKLVSIFANGQIYVFVTNKEQVDMIMTSNNYPGTRYTTNIEDFKAGRKTVLVCTNALARGLDVQAAVVVINFELCDPQRYMQRIGRVGRFGRAGTAIALIPPYMVDKSLGRPYTIQHITEAYKNTIRRWDFLEGDYPPRDDWVHALPGYGIEQSLLDEPEAGGARGMPAPPASQTQPPQAPGQSSGGEGARGR